jgi:D-glycero-D-manno-heptose 1,7-bisphosphate phosphatase
MVDVVRHPDQACRRAVFLDRDGVLNRALIRGGRPYPPTSLADLEILPDVREVCNRLRQQGYLLVVVTNQPDIARGTLEPSTLDAIHARLREQIRLDSIWVCPHDDADGCPCRKPAPGLLLQAAAHHQIDLGQSFLVGDRWRDVAAGRAAGCRTVLIDRAYEECKAPAVDAEVRNLAEAADWITSMRSCSGTTDEV